MWQRLGLWVTDLETVPSKEAGIAAAFRQLLRARDAGDRIAVYSATGAFSMRVRVLLRELLKGEPSWDSTRRGLEGFGLSSSGILYRADARVIRLADAMVWVRQADPCGGQWAEPFEAEM